MAQWPTCPVCGENANVGAVGGGGEHPAGQYLCTGCWSVFNGNDGEWQRHRKHREALPKQKAYWARVDWRGPPGTLLPEVEA